MTRQLALPLPVRPLYPEHGFLPAPSNEQALAWLADPGGWPAGRLAIYGAPGSGKTHLLHVFAGRCGALLLPGEALRHLPDLPEHGGIAVDDADIVPEPRALLHLLNAAAERALPVLLAGRSAPSRWQVNLPDLASRLRAVAATGLGLPDDGLLRALLRQLIAERQFRVDEQIQDYLLARLPRSGAAVREVVARLDRMSLAYGRRATRTMAAKVLCGMGEHEDEILVTVPPRQSPPEPFLI
jgi:chromosomal replication initiation ATPase DnaA